MLKEEAYVTDYNMCVTLSKLGYCEGSEYGITQYTEDFIYDGDPSHPESHKKGDIEVMRLYTKNKKDMGLYEVPLIYEVGKWLRDNKKLNIMVEYDVEKHKYISLVQNMIKNYISYLKGKFDSYEDAYKNSIKFCLKYI